MKEISCDCSIAEHCPQSKMGMQARCRIWKNEAPVSDLSSAEPGDTAIVALPIISVVNGGLYGNEKILQIGTPDGKKFRVPPESIRAIEGSPMKPLKVGDKVRFKKRNVGISGVLLALSGDSAWVKWETYPWPHTCVLNDLERAPIETEG